MNRKIIKWNVSIITALRNSNQYNMINSKYLNSSHLNVTFSHANTSAFKLHVQLINTWDIKHSSIFGLQKHRDYHVWFPVGILYCGPWLNWLFRYNEVRWFLCVLFTIFTFSWSIWHCVLEAYYSTSCFLLILENKQNHRFGISQ